MEEAAVALMEGAAVALMPEELHTGALELELDLDLEVDNKRVHMEALAPLELMGLSFEKTWKNSTYCVVLQWNIRRR